MLKKHNLCTERIADCTPPHFYGALPMVTDAFVDQCSLTGDGDTFPAEDSTFQLHAAAPGSPLTE
jgi:hypothetical protein